VFERAAEVRRRERIVDEQRHAVVVGDVRDALDVGRDQRGVPDRLEVDVRGVLVDGLGVPLVVERVDEPGRDAAALDGVGEVGVGAAVQRRGGDDVVTRRGEQERRHVERGHPRGGRDRADAALERGDPLFEGGVRRVHQPRVDVAGLLEAEQVSGVVGVVELVRGRLVDRRRARAGGRVRVRAGVYASRAESGSVGLLVCWHGSLFPRRVVKAGRPTRTFPVSPRPPPRGSESTVTELRDDRRGGGSADVRRSDGALVPTVNSVGP